MHIYLAIDDTDILGGPGSGQLAEILAEELAQADLVSKCSNISRHQLFVDDTIPYTSHNSAMCFSAVAADANLSKIIEYSSTFLATSAAVGSDPGLCIAQDLMKLNREELSSYGKEAKTSVLSKDYAYNTAEKLGIHLSEHGGTGDGVIGALAGIGLRISGDDGRFRGWHEFGEKGTITTPTSLCQELGVKAVIDKQGIPLKPESTVRIGNTRLKSIHYNHQEVLVVKPDVNSQNVWATLTPSEIKQF